MNCTTLPSWNSEEIDVRFHSYNYTKPYLKRCVIFYLIRALVRFDRQCMQNTRVLHLTVLKTAIKFFPSPRVIKILETRKNTKNCEKGPPKYL